MFQLHLLNFSLKPCQSLLESLRLLFLSVCLRTEAFEVLLPPSSSNFVALAVGKVAGEVDAMRVNKGGAKFISSLTRLGRCSVYARSLSI